MKRFLLTVSVACVTVVLLTACGREQIAANRETEPAISGTEPRPLAPFSEPSELSISGELKEVSLQTRTFVLRDEGGIERTFIFSHDTDVVGGNDIYGLSNQQRGKAKVVFMKIGDINRAVHIEITSN
jgi:hypothetical protein